MGRRSVRRNTNINYSYVKAYLNAVKLSSGCIECGENDPRCLDFHHVDPKQKRFHISNNRGRSLREIDAELRKCVVVCANCHRKIHAGQFSL